MKEQASILIVDDDQDILIAATYFLERHFDTVSTCADPEQIPELFRERDFDVTLLDMNFHPGQSNGEAGLHWLETIRSLSPEAVVVMITAHGSMNRAVEAMKRGAADYLTKPWDNQRLLATLSAALKLKQSNTELKRLRKSAHTLTAATRAQQHLIGKSAAMNGVMSLVRRAAPTDANVLILGENGTGKELVAHEIHQQSARRERIMIPVDMGSISATLFESELFGHVKGAFTDARDNRTGYIEAANGGTLFLDEIGNLPLNLQSKLLSVLEKRQVSQVGSSKVIPVDLRVIAATNMPIEQLSDPRHFRQDLLFRLNTVEIHLPPLRERSSDIPALADHFVKLYCQKYGKPLKKIPDRTMDALQQYPWPGNVRALRHSIERAVILSLDDVLQPEDFQLQHTPARRTVAPTGPVPATHDAASSSADGSAELNLDKVEYQTIARALRKNNYVISRTARELGLTRGALYRRMEKHGF